VFLQRGVGVEARRFPFPPKFTRVKAVKYSVDDVTIGDSFMFAEVIFAGSQITEKLLTKDAIYIGVLSPDGKSIASSAIEMVDQIGKYKASTTNGCSGAPVWTESGKIIGLHFGAHSGQASNYCIRLPDECMCYFRDSRVSSQVLKQESKRRKRMAKRSQQSKQSSPNVPSSSGGPQPGPSSQ
jgi:hypothetical protein